MTKRSLTLFLIGSVLLAGPISALAGESGIAVPKSSEERVRELEAEVKSLKDQINEIHRRAQRTTDALEADNRYLRGELERIRNAVGGGEVRPF